jgi:hypothetical protein
MINGFMRDHIAILIDGNVGIPGHFPDISFHIAEQEIITPADYLFL